MTDPQSRGAGSQHRPLLYRDIERAQRETRSNAEAARYLNVHFDTYKKYAVLYGLYERHSNKGGKGVSRPHMHGALGLQEILDGKHPNYCLKKLRRRLIAAGLLIEECGLCGFKTRRHWDNRCPLVLCMLDGNKQNFALKNLQLRCLNCAYLTSGIINAPVKERENMAVLNHDAMTVGGLTEDEIATMQMEIRSEIGED